MNQFKTKHNGLRLSTSVTVRYDEACSTNVTGRHYHPEFGVRLVSGQLDLGVAVMWFWKMRSSSQSEDTC